MLGSCFIRKAVISHAGLCRAPPHITRELAALFRDDREISRCFPTTWRYPSSELNFSHFMRWGYLKDTVYGRNILTLPGLQASITLHVGKIDRETPRTIVELIISRFEYVFDANQQHML